MDSIHGLLIKVRIDLTEGYVDSLVLRVFVPWKRRHCYEDVAPWLCGRAMGPKVSIQEESSMDILIFCPERTVLIDHSTVMQICPVNLIYDRNVTLQAES